MDPRWPGGTGMAARHGPLHAGTPGAAQAGATAGVHALPGEASGAALWVHRAVRGDGRAALPRAAAAPEYLEAGGRVACVRGAALSARAVGAAARPGAGCLARSGPGTLATLLVGLLTTLRPGWPAVVLLVATIAVDLGLGAFPFCAG